MADKTSGPTATKPPKKSASERLAELEKQMKDGQIWKSVVRHKLDESPRNRSLAVLSNVFL
ncbi:MAG: hypothetical protein KDB53_03685, partial [Planctomycetes bacterium]|nr:hypothetical protein [Planctomycetota bacterium]